MRATLLTALCACAALGCADVAGAVEYGWQQPLTHSVQRQHSHHRSEKGREYAEDNILFPSGSGRWRRPEQGRRAPAARYPSEPLRRSPAPTRRPTPPPRPPAAGLCGKVVVNRIINGRDAIMGQFPWQAGLIYTRGDQRSLLCGGALISPTFVLTAAHCLNQRDLKGWTLAGVRLGSLRNGPQASEEGALEVGVSAQSPHPRYTQNGVRGVRNAHDIALLRLRDPAPYTDFIRPVCLPENDQQNSATRTNSPQTFLVAGWGYTEDSVFSSSLRFASVVSEDPVDCARKLNVMTIADFQLCAIGRNKEDSCNGDSGGPLIASGQRAVSGDIVFQVEGIVSFGKSNCLEGNPGVYTRVASYLDWITQTMQS